MANKKRKRKSRKKSLRIIPLINIVLVLALLVCFLAMTTPGKNILDKVGIETGNFYFGSENLKDDEGKTDVTDKGQENVKSPITDASGNLRLDFLDVEQADSTVITTPGGSVIVIDTGTPESSEELIFHLSDMGVSEIEYMVLTHPHSDHIGGASAVLDDFEVKHVIMPELASSGSIFEETVSAIRKEKLGGCKVYRARMGDIYNVGGCEMKILAPAKPDSEDINNSSIAVTLKHKDFTALFTGDLEEKGENAILGYGFNIDCDLYKAGHHGSSTSSGNLLLDAATPSLCIISCGDENSYGHPHAAVTKALKDRNIKYYVTSRNGNITVLSDGKNYSVTTEK